MTFKGTNFLFDRNVEQKNRTIKMAQEEEWYVATCLENNIASQGKTIDEVMTNLKEAISLYHKDEAQKIAIKIAVKINPRACKQNAQV
jgi:predicted RNase H-like HicB family nuclease